MIQNEQISIFEKDKAIEEKFKECIKSFKVIRDAVHGDMWVTELEIKIIDTDLFQRLHKIRQLGPAYKVYPGAKHTRFEHSLGTLYMAQKIIDAINKNWELSNNHEISLSDYKMTAEDIFLTRIVALLHDLAHISYGHVLENEGELFGKKKQWLDDERRKFILEKIFRIIREYLSGKKIPDDKIDSILQEIEEILIAEEAGEDEISKLERPYVADIVGNTICADLLDYVKRDAYFTGLSISYDERIISYFGIKDYKGKHRVVINLERRSKVVRNDVLSYCIDLLKLRYSLAEKVHYHKVKTILSAMIIKMIDRAMRAKIINKNEILMDGDDILLWKIANTKEEIEDAIAAKQIAWDILNRNLYSIIYPEPDFVMTPTNETIINKFRDKDERYNYENLLRKTFSLKGICELSEASFVIYSPEPFLGKPAFTKMYVPDFDLKIQNLSELTQKYFPHYYNQIEAINSSYQYLRKFYILLRKEDLEKLERVKINKKIIKSTIEDILNDSIDMLVEVRAILLEELNGKTIPTSKKADTKNNIRYSHPNENIIEQIDRELLEE